MIILARTRWQYDSYKDLWELVRLAGFPTCYVDEIDLSLDAVFIVTPFNGELPELVEASKSRPRRARLVWWNGERPDTPDMPTVVAHMDSALQLVSDVWVTDGYYASLDPHMQYVPVGGDARLAGEPVVRPSTFSYDYAHMSYVHGRRGPILQSIRGEGMLEAPPAWGAERDRLLRTSRVMVSVHQTEAPINEGLRIALAAAYRMPYVSEHLASPWPLIAGEDYIDARAEELPRAVRALVTNVHTAEVIGESLHQRLCQEHTFTRWVKRGVEELRSRG